MRGHIVIICQIELVDSIIQYFLCHYDNGSITNHVGSGIGQKATQGSSAED